MLNSKNHNPWFVFAGFCLAVSGVLSLPIFLGKIPALAAFLPDLAWTKWSLVIHVFLALIMWHVAVPIGLNVLYSPECYRKGLGNFSLMLCSLGCIALFISLPSEEVRPLLINYIPFLTSWTFIAGVALCLVGLLGGMLSAVSLKMSVWRDPHCFPLQLGILFYVVITVTLIFAIFSQKSLLMQSQFSALEYIVWGPGHLLQHLSSLYLLVSWNILLSPSGRPFLFRNELLPSYFALAVPFLFLPTFIHLPAHDIEYRQAFTTMMQWGIFPAFIIFVVQVLRHRKMLQHSEIDLFKLIAFVLSFVLLTLGFIFGALIDGYNLKIPGHYHATIGAITIAFMAIVLTSMTKRKELQKIKAFKYLFSSYGIGQILFSSGLFIAGVFEMERKTYGSEIELLSHGKKLGISLAAVGGSFALIGGVLFACSFLYLLGGGDSKKQD